MNVSSRAVFLTYTSHDVEAEFEILTEENEGNKESPQVFPLLR